MSVDPITCHILDTTQGKPATGVVVQLYHLSTDPTDYEPTEAKLFATGKTDTDGRIKKWVFDPKIKNDETIGINGESQSWDVLKPGIYKAKFLTGKYFLGLKELGLNRTFFPFVEIIFIIDNPPDHHYHIPLLLSNFSYSTYRGS